MSEIYARRMRTAFLAGKKLKLLDFSGLPSGAGNGDIIGFLPIFRRLALISAPLLRVKRLKRNVCTELSQN
jgi:hypothetical protein